MCRAAEHVASCTISKSRIHEVTNCITTGLAVQHLLQENRVCIITCKHTGESQSPKKVAEQVSR